MLRKLRASPRSSHKA
jgi:hypothetical protein